jgi:dUTP pyrophosphatase
MDVKEIVSTEEQGNLNELIQKLVRLMPDNLPDCYYNRPVKTIAPLKHDFGNAGYDMFVTKDTWIFPFLNRKVPVNLKAELPMYHFGFMTSRSGESLKGNVVTPGIIDSNYRGQMNAIMHRVGLLPRRLKKGTRIAQLIVLPYRELNWIYKEKLSETKRGKNGFGNSGII